MYGMPWQRIAPSSNVPDASGRFEDDIVDGTVGSAASRLLSRRVIGQGTPSRAERGDLGDKGDRSFSSFFLFLDTREIEERTKTDPTVVTQTTNRDRRGSLNLALEWLVLPPRNEHH
jgi:hypothetical protein